MIRMEVIDFRAARIDESSVWEIAIGAGGTIQAGYCMTTHRPRKGTELGA